MQYKVTACEVKNKDWKVITVVDAEGEGSAKVSVNRADKEGNPFPFFDDIQEGGMVSGKLWRSPKGNMYLFAESERRQGGRPKPQVDSGPAAQNPASAELKNILMQGIMPKLDKIIKELEIIRGLNPDAIDESFNN